MSARRVLVTGSSRGIGLAIARRLASQGWRVALHARHTDHLQAAADAIGDSRAGSYGADFSEVSAATKLWGEVLADGPVHALVANAGIYRSSAFLDADDAEFESVFAESIAVNLAAPVRLMRAAGKTFYSQGGGAILAVASRVGFRGEAGAAAYAASKAGLINLVRSLAVELAPWGVRMHGIAPGWVDTAMARDGMEARWQEIVAGIPLGRMATTEDCAAASAFLLGEDAAYLSGVVLDINGASYFH